MDIKVPSLWEEFSIPLKKFISKRISNQQDNEDILQEVFLKINSNIVTLKDKQKLHAWIYRIAKNTIIDFYRNNNYIKEIELIEDSIKVTDENFSMNEEILGCLKPMINHLPEKYKQAIILTEYKNITQKELSEQLGISLSGAKSRVQRGRKMLKDMILDCCSLEFDKTGNIIDYKYKTKGCKSC
ncbi:RNA polymerase sigma factor SigZ [Clostridium algoriphilum]|uniref:RNA polymerase sigma factor SigZ n=1 Tax=Clostridium algoriphilum TaxID=198347 RepID=UPI001CF5B777|nr:RNA polymerase sigma factor SigZ [Clostridium algoriphilum]MCB2294533.1 RNA polymerase sigma factor SigZ [Clostridium algoriphilum]